MPDNQEENERLMEKSACVLAEMLIKKHQEYDRMRETVYLLAETLIHEHHDPVDVAHFDRQLSMALDAVSLGVVEPKHVIEVILEYMGS